VGPRYYTESSWQDAARARKNFSGLFRRGGVVQIRQFVAGGSRGGVALVKDWNTTWDSAARKKDHRATGALGYPLVGGSCCCCWSRKKKKKKKKKSFIGQACVRFLEAAGGTQGAQVRAASGLAGAGGGPVRSMGRRDHFPLPRCEATNKRNSSENAGVPKFTVLVFGQTGGARRGGAAENRCCVGQCPLLSYTGVTMEYSGDGQVGGTRPPYDGLDSLR